MSNDEKKKGKPEIKVHSINLNDIVQGDEETIREIAEAIAGEDLPEEVSEAIAKLIGKVKDEIGEPFASATEAHTAALTFLGECHPVAGQLVERNERGMKEYNHPASGERHESAIVIDAWPSYRFHPKDGKLVNGVIAVMTGKGSVHMHAVDLRAYKPATAKTN